MKRLFATLMLLVCLCSVALADREMSVNLDTKNKFVQTDNLGFASVTCEYLDKSSTTAKVRIKVKNNATDQPIAIILFRQDMEEPMLRGYKNPQFEFEKTYQPDAPKDGKTVQGCPGINNTFDIIAPEEVLTIFDIEVPFKNPVDVTLPFYQATYDAKKFKKSGKNSVKYKILKEQKYVFKVAVKGWTEDDPQFVSVKASVDSLIANLETVKFCDNPKHKPTLKEQQWAQQSNINDLSNMINDVMRENGWMTEEEPYMAYNALLQRLSSIDLNSYNADCGKHPAPAKGHKCNYCSLSAQELCHKLEDTYQLLYTDKIKKKEAMNRAKAMYGCYQKNKSRKKDSVFGSKISEYYSKIINY